MSIEYKSSGEQWWLVEKSGATERTGRMFYGENQHSIDAKGRVFVPVKYRNKLGDSFMVTMGLEKCLFVYPQEEWDKVVASMDSLNNSEKNARDVIRFFFTNAEECETDKQGRVLIPQNLREYASLEKDVYINGVNNRVEIWDKQTYEAYKKESTYEKIAEKIESHKVNV